MRVNINLIKKEEMYLHALIPKHVGRGTSSAPTFSRKYLAPQCDRCQAINTVWCDKKSSEDI